MSARGIKVSLLRELETWKAWPATRGSMSVICLVVHGLNKWLLAFLLSLSIQVFDLCPLPCPFPSLPLPSLLPNLNHHPTHPPTLLIPHRHGQQKDLLAAAAAAVATTAAATMMSRGGGRGRGGPGGFRGGGGGRGTQHVCLPSFPFPIHLTFTCGGAMNWRTCVSGH